MLKNLFELLVSHWEFIGLLFVAASKLVLDATNQVIVHGVLNGLLNDIQPPGGA